MRIEDIQAHWTEWALRWVDAPGNVLTWLGLRPLGRLWIDYPGRWLWNWLCDVQGDFYVRCLRDK